MKKKTKKYCFATAEEIAEAEAFLKKIKQERENAMKNEIREGNFYVEFDYEGSGEPYVMQTRLFKTIKSAKQFIRKNFDFIDFDLIQISIMEEVEEDKDDGLRNYDIITALRIKKYEDLEILNKTRRKSK